jgi:serine/threonine-protein kinase HipA
MSSAGRFDTLYLWYLGDPAQPVPVGTLQAIEGGKSVSLRYAPDWLGNGFPLSEDLPLVDIEHLPTRKHCAPGAVDDARPDRWGERVIRFIDKPARLSLMEFLFYAGDDRFGALGVSSSANEYVPRKNGPLPRLADAAQLAQVINKIQQKEAITEQERRIVSAGGSLGGAKPKALLEDAGVEWVIKFFNNEPIDVPLVEHASMTLAARAGIRVAETRVLALPGEHALLVRRFDRLGQRRMHCLSAATALYAAEGEFAELSYPNLAQLLRRRGDTAQHANQQDMAELFRRMVFNILIDNTDDHEKNHAVLVQTTARATGFDKATLFRLAPAYDVLPTNSGQGRQEFGVGADGHDSTLANAMSQCAQFGLSAPEAAATVVQVIAVVDGWQAHFRALHVSEADIASLAAWIDGEPLLTQRRSFDLNDYSAKRNVRRKAVFGS